MTIILRHCEEGRRSNLKHSLTSTDYKSALTGFSLLSLRIVERISVRTLLDSARSDSNKKNPSGFHRRDFLFRLILKLFYFFKINIGYIFAIWLSCFSVIVWICVSVFCTALLSFVHIFACSTP